MNKSKVFGTSTALAAILLLAWPAAADVIYDNGSPRLTQVSGFSGGPVWILGSISAPYRAISRIEWDEKTNHPCYFNVEGTHMNNKNVRRFTVNRCGSKGQPDGDIGANSGFKGVRTDDAYGIYVSGLRVCMNNQNTRVKGLQIRASVVEGDQVIDYSDWTPPADTSSSSVGDSSFSITYVDDTAERPNCNGNWKHWVNCHEGELPSALYLHFNNTDTPGSLKGVALACREVLPKS